LPASCCQQLGGRTAGGGDQRPAFREKHPTPRGHEPVANTPDEFARFLAEDRATSARIVKEAGVEPQ
jgi:hypothetical protein